MMRYLQGSAMIVFLGVVFTLFPTNAFGTNADGEECNQLCEAYILRETYLAMKEKRSERPLSVLVEELATTRWIKEVGKIKSEAAKDPKASQRLGSPVR